ncbi:MAG: hypothetical protein GY851_13250, partial [bacterium]|nr:hypothetical protein [bacterium]
NDGVADGADYRPLDTDGDAMPNVFDDDDDNDGYSDADEVSNGWDPLDPNDPDPATVPVAGWLGICFVALAAAALGIRRLASHSAIGTPRVE